MAQFLLKDTAIALGVLIVGGVGLKALTGKSFEAETFEAEQCKHQSYYRVRHNYDDWEEDGDRFCTTIIKCSDCGVEGEGRTNLSHEETPDRNYTQLWWEDIGYEAETFEADGIREGRYGSILNFGFNEGNISWEDDVLPLVEEYTNDWNAQGIGFGEVSVSVQSPRKVVLEKLKADLDNELGGYIYYEAETFNAEEDEERINGMTLEEWLDEIDRIKATKEPFYYSNNILGSPKYGNMIDMFWEQGWTPQGILDAWESYDRQEGHWEKIRAETFNADDKHLIENTEKLNRLIKMLKDEGVWHYNPSISDYMIDGDMTEEEATELYYLNYSDELFTTILYLLQYAEKGGIKGSMPYHLNSDEDDEESYLRYRYGEPLENISSGRKIDEITTALQDISSEEMLITVINNLSTKQANQLLNRLMGGIREGWIRTQPFLNDAESFNAETVNEPIYLLHDLASGMVCLGTESFLRAEMLDTYFYSLYDGQDKDFPEDYDSKPIEEILKEIEASVGQNYPDYYRLERFDFPEYGYWFEPYISKDDGGAIMFDKPYAKLDENRAKLGTQKVLMVQSWLKDDKDAEEVGE